MRNNIVSNGAHELKYEIREIVGVAKEFQKLGLDITWENIGDPVQKGETLPDWIKDLIACAMKDDLTYAYSPTKGVDATREFLAGLTNRNGRIKISKEDIIFFNGLGEAISKVYSQLRREYRVIGPSPAYSTHSSAEASHAGSEHITYTLEPGNSWYPNLDDLRMKVKYNPSISGILLVNPDNPTGAVYPKEVMQEIVACAKDYDLFVVCDEIYTNLTYNGRKSTPLADVINGVCGIAMRGISKELPWPGARCGWIEVYNADRDPVFARYVKSIVDDKMLEVCSTTLPQQVIPAIMSDSRYPKYIGSRNAAYERRSRFAYESLKDVRGVLVNQPNGAFYLTVMFDNDVLTPHQTLAVANTQAREKVERIVRGASLDKRFVYYLLAATGICVVPLTGFNCDLQGFRVTLLESNDAKFEWIIQTLKERISEYLDSWNPTQTQYRAPKARAMEIVESAL